MILFYLLISVMPLSQHPLWAQFMGELTVFKYIGGVCLVYAVFHLGARRKLPPLFVTWQARLFVVFYLTTTVSYFTKERGQVVWEVSPFLSYTSFLLLFFITIAVVDSVRRLRWVLLVAIGSAAFGSLYVIREWQKYHNAYPGFRPGWVVGDPNYFTVSALLCLPLAFYLMLEGRSRAERFFCLSCLVVTLVAVILAASRGGFVGLGAAFLFVLWRSRQRLRNLVALGILVVPLSLAAPRSPVVRLLHPSRSDEQAAENRVTLWNAGLRMIRGHPVMGVGLGNFRRLVGQYEEPGATQQFVAHNTYVEVAAEMGLPALLVFLAILWLSYRTLERTRRRTTRSDPPLLRQAALGIEAGLVGAGLAIFFVSGQYQKLLWLMVFLSMCLPTLVPVRSNRVREPEATRADGGVVQADGEFGAKELLRFSRDML